MTEKLKLHPRHIPDKVEKLYRQLDTERSALHNLESLFEGKVTGSKELSINIGRPLTQIGSTSARDISSYATITLGAEHSMRKELSYVLKTLVEDNIKRICQELMAAGYDPSST